MSSVIACVIAFGLETCACCAQDISVFENPKSINPKLADKFFNQWIQLRSSRDLSIGRDAFLEAVEQCSALEKSAGRAALVARIFLRAMISEYLIFEGNQADLQFSTKAKALTMQEFEVLVVPKHRKTFRDLIKHEGRHFVSAASYVAFIPDNPDTAGWFRAREFVESVHNRPISQLLAENADASAFIIQEGKNIERLEFIIPSIYALKSELGVEQLAREHIDLVPDLSGDPFSSIRHPIFPKKGISMSDLFNPYLHPNPTREIYMFLWFTSSFDGLRRAAEDAK